MNSAAQADGGLCQGLYFLGVRVEPVAGWVADNRKGKVRLVRCNVCKPGEQIGKILVRSHPAHVEQQTVIRRDAGTATGSGTAFRGVDRSEIGACPFANHLDALWPNADKFY